MKSILIASMLAAIVAANVAKADCVYGAKDKTSFIVLDSHSILLRGGYGADILIKSFTFFHNTSNVSVLKDDFCSYDNAVLYVDGEVVDASQVTRVN